jgi:alkanesulfonate monooxygenase SsuD/methylene tetrahydromethanopterin reductase-like flavin-dependent oxidoreductase (luciferase family)
MPPRIGYLLPTREQILIAQPQASPLLELAVRAERLGFDSLWVGDSLLARPRHEPLTLLAAVASRVPRVDIGTAVLLLILGVGIAADVPNIRAEFTAAGVPFEKRVGRLLEGVRLARALWTGQPVSWDGRWKVENAVLGPTPYRVGGPPIWIGGSLPASRERAGRYFDGWMPIAPNAEQWQQQWAEIQTIARQAERDPTALTGAMYLSVVVDDDTARANDRLDHYLERYYGQPAAAVRKWQACYAGSGEGLAEWLRGYAAAGVDHFVLRFAGDHERHLNLVAGLRNSLG